MQVHYESLDLLRLDIDDYCVPFVSFSEGGEDHFLSLSLLCCSTISTLIADQMFRLVERVNSIAEHSSSLLTIAC
jgi:hypothetical protein